ncbi:proteasome maturation protein [Diorhabda sublineata]|uniref:proteasome maturation protein n=1 Tax=Diorhabda sublineata TaxID=1163346 RepID=UPI0024E167B6|nr:proteasome maturation protein [Diorhabda sublineata]
MSFGLPSVKVKPSVADTFDLKEDSFGGQELMKYGLQSGRKTPDVLHPLATSETKYRASRQQMNMTILRNTQGLHAPLRLAMELKSSKKIGRLPFLPSSNIMHEVLTGQDLEIGAEDIFNTSEFTEYSGQPHAVVEKSLGIL